MREIVRSSHKTQVVVLSAFRAGGHVIGPVTCSKESSWQNGSPKPSKSGNQSA